MSDPLQIKSIEEIMGKLRDHEQRITEIEHRLLDRQEVDLITKKNNEDIIQMVLSKPLETNKQALIHNLSGLTLFLSILDLVNITFYQDSLSPTEISSILVGKFGIKVERSNISHTLSSAISKGYVDRVKNDRGSGYLYRATQLGVDYLRAESSKIQT